jgi:hypothetical protein
MVWRGQNKVGISQQVEILSGVAASLGRSLFAQPPGVMPLIAFSAAVGTQRRQHEQPLLH